MRIWRQMQYIGMRSFHLRTFVASTTPQPKPLLSKKLNAINYCKGCCCVSLDLLVVLIYYWCFTNLRLDGTQIYLHNTLKASCKRNTLLVGRVAGERLIGTCAGVPLRELRMCTRFSNRPQMLAWRRLKKRAEKVRRQLSPLPQR